MPENGPISALSKGEVLSENRQRAHHTPWRKPHRKTMPTQHGDSNRSWELSGALEAPATLQGTWVDCCLFAILATFSCIGVAYTRLSYNLKRFNNRTDNGDATFAATTVKLCKSRREKFYPCRYLEI